MISASFFARFSCLSFSFSCRLQLYSLFLLSRLNLIDSNIEPPGLWWFATSWLTEGQMARTITWICHLANFIKWQVTSSSFHPLFCSMQFLSLILASSLCLTSRTFETSGLFNSPYHCLSTTLWISHFRSKLVHIFAFGFAFIDSRIYHTWSWLSLILSIASQEEIENLLKWSAPFERFTNAYCPPFLCTSCWLNHVSIVSLCGQIFSYCSEALFASIDSSSSPQLASFITFHSYFSPTWKRGNIFFLTFKSQHSIWVNESNSIDDNRDWR